MNDPTASRPLHEFRTRRRIEFADTDMGGIVHFSRFFVFMETAEHEFLRELGTSVHLEIDGQQIGWPRVSASCDYVNAVRYGDEIEIHLRVARKGAKSMTYECFFWKESELVARGRMSSVCCVLNAPEGLRSIPIPDLFAERVAQAPESQSG
jgi:YbgC/YbaW family acyl-CoA thioester hydrolase